MINCVRWVKIRLMIARWLVASFKLQGLNGVATTCKRTMAGCQTAKAIEMANKVLGYQLQWAEMHCWTISTFAKHNLGVVANKN